MYIVFAIQIISLLCFLKDIRCTCTELPIGIALWYKLYSDEIHMKT